MTAGNGGVDLDFSIDDGPAETPPAPAPPVPSTSGGPPALDFSLDGFALASPSAAPGQAAPSPPATAHAPARPGQGPAAPHPLPAASGLDFSIDNLPLAPPGTPPPAAAAPAAAPLDQPFDLMGDPFAAPSEPPDLMVSNPLAPPPGAAVDASLSAHDAPTQPGAFALEGLDGQMSVQDGASAAEDFDISLDDLGAGAPPPAAPAPDVGTGAWSDLIGGASSAPVPSAVPEQPVDAISGAAVERDRLAHLSATEVAQALGGLALEVEQQGELERAITLWRAAQLLDPMSSSAAEALARLLG